MKDRTGHCVCGAVRFTITDMRDDFSICHCKMCQRWTGMAFAGLAVEPAQLAVIGAEYIGSWRSSDVSERSFCKRCGSTLWFVDLKDGAPHNCDVAIGLLDDTDGLRLNHEIFIDRKPGAFSLVGDHSRETEAEYFRKIGHVPNPTPTEGLQ